jgi:hypothetical protein
MFWKLSDMDKSKFVNRKTKKVDKVDLNPSCFAFVGDIEDTSTWKLPIRILGDERKTFNHIKSALARFDETKGIPEAERPFVWFTLFGAAKALGIDVERRQFTRLVAETPKAETLAVELDDKPKAVDRELAAAIADADRRADEFLKRLGLE